MSTPPSPNLNDDRGPELQALLIAMIVIPTVAVIIRFWSRALLPGFSLSKQTLRFWWDDWFALAAACFNIAVCGIGIYLVSLGMGKHVQIVPPENITPFLLLLWVEYYVFDIGTVLGKSSALFFYARVFSNPNSRFKWALWIVHGLNAAWLIALIFAIIFECSPIERAWVPTLPGTCSNTDALWLGSGVPSLLIDLVILIMPVPMLWRLRMKKNRKWLIMGVFICGYLVVVVSIGRLVTIAAAGSGLQDDPTYNIATPVFWLGSEIAISVICVSLPSIFFFLRRARRDGFRSLLSTTTHGSRAKLRGPSSSSDHPTAGTGDLYGDSTELTVTHSASSIVNDPFATGPDTHVTSIRALQGGPHQGVADAELEPTGIRVTRDVDVV